MVHRFHKFDRARADLLVSSDRARFLPPAQVLALLDAQPGHAVADIGCGPDCFTLPLVRRVRPLGRVLALDICPDMLERLRERLAVQAIDGSRRSSLRSRACPSPAPAATAS